MTDTKQKQSAQVGDVIAGKYRIEGILGTGGMGVVFAATQLDLERLVAVKVMRAELAEFPGAVQRLLLEAKVAAKFRGEHVCRVLDVGTLPDGAPYIVMEYLEGSDLSTILAKRGGPFDVETAIDFVLEACEALAEAHAANVVHRDLKPENLFVANQLDSSPTIKVLDFGISKQVGARTTARSLTNPSAALGSPYYMAPEQMRAAKDVDARADIWAIGAILFELLTGRQAFDGENLTEVCAAVMEKPPKRASELRPQVSEQLADAIDRCLRKDPNERFADVGELATVLAPFGSKSKAEASLRRIERVLAGSGGAHVRFPHATTGTISAAASTVSATRRRKLPWLAFVGVGVLALGAFTVPRLHGEQSRASQSQAQPGSLVPVAAPAVTQTAAELPGPATQAAAPAVTASGGAEPHSETANAPPASGPRALSAPTTSPRVRRPRLAKEQPTTPAPSAATADPSKNTHNLTDAWDTTSFGPRH